MVVCLNLGRHELSFFFAKILFGMNVNGHTNPSCAKETERITLKHSFNDNYTQLMEIFVLWPLNLIKTCSQGQLRERRRVFDIGHWRAL